MAQTVTFGGAGFDIPSPGPGQPTLTASTSQFNADASSPSFTLRNANNSQITGLGFQDNSVNGLTLTIASQTRTSASGSTFSMGDANDTLVIGASTSNQFFMGNGNNSVTFQYGSTSDVINFGTGSDTLVFGGKVTNTTVQLTTDASVDTIKIAQSTTPTTGLKITGATDIDVLFIGTTQYNYDSSQSAWVNTGDSSDKKFFN